MAGDTENIAHLIKTVTENQNNFVFAEYFEHPSIKSLSGAEQDKQLQLLHLFCYGSFEDYLLNASLFPDMTDLQIRKLRQLTIISEAYKNKQLLYRDLMDKLALASIRELEDLIIDLIYSEAIKGKIDQQKMLLEIEYAIGRDIKKEEINQLLTSLDTWYCRVHDVMSRVELDIKNSSKIKSEYDSHRKQISTNINTIKANLHSTNHKFEVDCHKMDVDDQFSGSFMGEGPDKEAKSKRTSSIRKQKTLFGK